MKDETRNPETSDLSDDFRASARSVLTVDVEKYQSWLDSSEMSQAQKEEFLQALWSIVVSFVELGYGVHPLQETCGQDDPDGADTPTDAPDQVDLQHGENNKLE